MGYNIYYMYDVMSGMGYIGQNKDDDDEKRILDHVSCYISNKGIEKDGAARLIKDMGGLSSSLRYKYFFPNTNGRYGIPLEVYTNFFEYWDLDGKNKLDQLTEPEILDLAEMFHIIAAGLQGRNWNKYNTRPGGFDTTKKLTYHFSTTEAEKISELKKTLPNIRTSLEVTNFSVDLRRKPEDWKKIVFPIGQVVTTAILDEKIKKLLSQEFWFALINSLSLQEDLTKVFVNQIKEMRWTMPENWGPNIKKVVIKNNSKKNKDASDKFSDEIKQVFRNHINKKETKELIQSTIKKVFRNQNLNFHWEFSNDALNRFIKAFESRLNDISLNMWSNIFSLFDVKKEKFTGSIFSKNGEGLSLIKFNLPHFMVDFQWDSNQILPKWAQVLKSTPLTNSFNNPSQGKLKSKICEIICKELFPIVESVATKRPSKNDYLLFRVFHKTADKTKGYDKDFFNILLTIWHQYKYGPNAWITRAEYFGISTDSIRANYIANRNIVDQVDKVWWYSGKAWEKYRNYVNNSSSDSFEQAGKLLADLWEW